MRRLAVVLVVDAVNDLTLAEKLACTQEYGECWWDDVDFAIVGPREQTHGLAMMFGGDRAVHECVVRRVGLSARPESVYLFHH